MNIRGTSCREEYIIMWFNFITQNLSNTQKQKKKKKEKRKERKEDIDADFDTRSLFHEIHEYRRTERILTRVSCENELVLRSPGRRSVRHSTKQRKLDEALLLIERPPLLIMLASRP